MTDVLFDHIAALQADRPWGSVLDAGTGKHSLRWVRELPTARWTAVTADPDMLRAVEQDAGARRATDRMVKGDWSDPTLLAGESFDVVLADYLLGAIDGFAPYFQDQLFERLARHVGGRLYVVGMEPLPLRPSTEPERLVVEMARVRDAVLLLAQERPYREFPMEWVERHLALAGLRVVSSRRFRAVFGHGWIDRQIDMSVRRMGRLPEPSVRAGMETYLASLRARAHEVCDRHKGLPCGHDHVVAAERQPTDR